MDRCRGKDQQQSKPVRWNEMRRSGGWRQREDEIAHCEAAFTPNQALRRLAQGCAAVWECRYMTTVSSANSGMLQCYMLTRVSFPWASQRATTMLCGPLTLIRLALSHSPSAGCALPFCQTNRGRAGGRCGPCSRPSVGFPPVSTQPWMWTCHNMIYCTYILNLHCLHKQMK